MQTEKSREELVELTRRLLAFDTTNPPGRELEAMQFCAQWLEGAGFRCELQHLSPGRANLVATRGLGEGLPLCFSGHLDTVPLGDAPWSVPPFEGIVEDDFLYGRGATDMKGAIAAFMLACRDNHPVRGGVSILLTAGEETGSDGARELAAAGLIPAAGAMIVGEPSANRPLAGHKGAFWLKLGIAGKAAHGSTPDQGVNAIIRALPVLDRLAQLDLDIRHPLLGSATANLGTIRGGHNVNSVPDLCEFTLDIRSVEGISHEDLLGRVRAAAGADATIEVLIDLPPVWTDPQDPWFRKARSAVSAIAGQELQAGTATYFTDASVLKPAMNDLPVLILGPGTVEQAHRTDEHVRVSKLLEAVAIYGALLRDWDGRV